MPVLRAEPDVLSEPLGEAPVPRYILLKEQKDIDFIQIFYTKNMFLQEQKIFDFLGFNKKRP